MARKRKSFKLWTDHPPQPRRYVRPGEPGYREIFTPHQRAALRWWARQPTPPGGPFFNDINIADLIADYERATGDMGNEQQT